MTLVGPTWYIGIYSTMYKVQAASEAEAMTKVMECRMKNERETLMGEIHIWCNCIDIDKGK